MRSVHVFRLAAIISRSGAFVVLRSSVRNQALKFQMVKKHMPRGSFSEAIHGGMWVFSPRSADSLSYDNYVRLSVT